MNKESRKNKFAICIDSGGNDDLRIWKLYQVLADSDAENEDYMRVVDESGEDYLYPKSRFAVVEFSASVEKKILSAAQAVA